MQTNQINLLCGPSIVRLCTGLAHPSVRLFVHLFSVYFNTYCTKIFGKHGQLFLTLKFKL